ncbi:hypothetical protein [Leptospira weilii]|uniref:hypothetical protein n=1 Tax=Leptospira weilii TaxID=28184 RepID=UPI0012DA096B|nr:hypothetical protein [Leptospira weilii]
MKKSNYHKSHTVLSKYILEKMVQQVDFNESISYRHRTTNGFILIQEIQSLSNLSLKRIRTTHRLSEAIVESQSAKLSSSIVNDYIINKYCSDIVDYYKSLNYKEIAKENYSKIIELSNKSKIHYIRLLSEYFSYIKLEFNMLDLNSEKIKRHCNTIDKLIGCLIPYLLEFGYSPQTIFAISTACIRKEKDKFIEFFFEGFNHLKRNYKIIKEVNVSTQSIIENYLKEEGIAYSHISRSQIESAPTSYQGNFLEFQVEVLDPISFIRTAYDESLKKVVSSAARITLSEFNDYFQTVYIRNSIGRPFKPKFKLDPLNVPERSNTLQETLKLIAPFYKFNDKMTNSLPSINAIFDSTYYYNLALGSKSIENSIFLLWTALESLLPYHPEASDIGNVRYFTSKFLSIGAVGRRIVAFMKRLQNVKSYSDILNASPLIPDIKNIYDRDDIIKTFNWLTDVSIDSLDMVKFLNEESPLLANYYFSLKEEWGQKFDINGNCTYQGNFGLFKKIIENSEESIRHQIDRIYLHRNRIVHSALVINEYSNLWHHLEWYVGKLLSYCYVFNLRMESEFKKDVAFIQLEGSIDSTLNYLNINSKEPISSNSHLMLLIFEHVWLFF